MCRSPSPTSSRTSATAVPLALLLVVALGGCARPDRVAEPVRPLERTAAPASDAGSPVGPAAAAPPSGGDATRATPTTQPPGDEAIATVSSVLADYGELLGELSADPAGAPGPGTPARARWDAVVLADSPLSADLLDRIGRRVTEDRMVVTAGAGGISFRHVPTRARKVTGEAIDFEWCGWSPGIGRSIDTGEVVDDSVAHATGVGRVVLVGGSWRLASLDQHGLELLAPGAPDPCPAADPTGRS